MGGRPAGWLLSVVTIDGRGDFVDMTSLTTVKLPRI